LVDSLFDKPGCGRRQIGLPEFQEGGFHILEAAGTGQVRGHGADCLVG
jgi:hypothetical protein